jgi:TPR repeat protein
MACRTKCRTLAAAMLCAATFASFAPVLVRAQAPVISPATSLDDLRAFAVKGNADAMLELGERLVQGTGVAVDAQGGMAWLQKAADGGKPEAWYSMGVIFSNGIGVTGDPLRAMAYFRKGAAFGDANCQTSLGMYYQAGDRIKGGVAADPPQAIQWYRMAAEQNHQEAIQHLGMMYLRGDGIQANADSAARWFRKGAVLGNPECQWSLGMCYLHGQGAAKDTVAAYALCAAAADGAENPEMKKGMIEQTEKLRQGLSKEQAARADASAAEWKSKRQ